MSNKPTKVDDKAIYFKLRDYLHENFINTDNMPGTCLFLIP